MLHTSTKDSWDDRSPSTSGEQTDIPVDDHVDFTISISGSDMLTMQSTDIDACKKLHEILAQACRQLAASMQSLGATAHKQTELLRVSLDTPYMQRTVSTLDYSRWETTPGQDMVTPWTRMFKLTRLTNTSLTQERTGRLGHVNHKLNAFQSAGATPLGLTST